jgi:hypothetical protein
VGGTDTGGCYRAEAGSEAEPRISGKLLVMIYQIVMDKAILSKVMSSTSTLGSINLVAIERSR